MRYLTALQNNNICLNHTIHERYVLSDVTILTNYSVAKLAILSNMTSSTYKDSFLDQSVLVYVSYQTLVDIVSIKENQL